MGHPDLAETCLDPNLPPAELPTNIAARIAQATATFVAQALRRGFSDPLFETRCPNHRPDRRLIHHFWMSSERQRLFRCGVLVGEYRRKAVGLIGRLGQHRGEVIGLGGCVDQ